MIRYALVCEAGHGFESWFRSSGDYDRQRQKRLIACPTCGSTAVEKQIMAPAVARSERKSAPPDKAAAREEKSPGEEKTPVAMISPEEREVRRRLKALRDHVVKNADYVGDQFADLARRMHYEEISKRSIYGEAKPDEVRALIEEGVEVQPLPVLPEDRN